MEKKCNCSDSWVLTAARHSCFSSPPLSRMENDTMSSETTRRDNRREGQSFPQGLCLPHSSRKKPLRLVNRPSSPWSPETSQGASHWGNSSLQPSNLSQFWKSMTGIIQEKQRETQPKTFNLALAEISNGLPNVLKGSMSMTKGLR